MENRRGPDFALQRSLRSLLEGISPRPGTGYKITLYRFFFAGVLCANLKNFIYYRISTLLW